MVVLPSEFVQLDPCPGYYWNRYEKKLYSCKIDGLLKPLTFQKGFRGMFADRRLTRLPATAFPSMDTERS